MARLLALVVIVVSSSVASGEKETPAGGGGGHVRQKVVLYVMSLCSFSCLPHGSSRLKSFSIPLRPSCPLVSLSRNVEYTLKALTKNVEGDYYFLFKKDSSSSLLLIVTFGPSTIAAFGAPFGRSRSDRNESEREITDSFFLYFYFLTVASNVATFRRLKLWLLLVRMMTFRRQIRGSWLTLSWAATWGPHTVR